MEIVCLKCRRPKAPGAIFCDDCGGLCESGEAPDYFFCLGVPRNLNPDLEDLEKKFYALSVRLHPDRFAASAPREREASEIFSSRLNQAYRCLKDPVERATYLVGLEGLSMAGEGKVPTELAEEYFEMQEAKEENPAALAELSNTLKRRQVELAGEFEKLCKTWQVGNTPTLKKIAANLNAQNYLRSMLRDMKGIKR